MSANGEDKKKLSVIDLLDSEDDDDELLKDAKPIFSKKKKQKRKPSPDSVVGAATTFFATTNDSTATTAAAAAAAEDQKPAAVENLQKLGSFASSIVGAQSYPGVARRGDTLSLARDTNNPYDRNAIQFNNTSDGAKRGNLPRDQAAVVAPLIDKNHFKFTATIQSAGDRYKIPVVVDVSAKSYRVLNPTEIQQMTDSVGAVLSKKLQWTTAAASAASETSTAVAAMKEVAASTNQAMAALSNAVAAGVAEPQSPTALPSIEDFIPAQVDLTEMDWDSQQEELDALFEKIQQEQLSDLPDIGMPKQFDKMQLYDYQQDGIKWLVNQERTETAPPFYTLRQSMMNGGRDQWCCNITGIKHAQRPPPIRGGVLADDMGLGKTLQTLGLILCNPPADQKGYPYVRRSLSAKQTEPRCTLIVCPVSVMANWLIQIKKHVNLGGRKIVLKTTRYHGPKRDGLVALIQYNQTDVMITSYNTLSYDYRKYMEEMDPKNPKKRKASVANQVTIFDVCFHRVVLDEAHIIRSSQTSFFKATNALQAKYKLCLTGTPFVNRPSDIHSLLAFLQVPPLCQKSAFDRAVTNRIKQRDDRGLSTLRTTMAYVALRRNKVQVHDTIQLPEKVVLAKKLKFSEGIHKTVHDMLYLSARAVFLGFLRRRKGEDEIIDNYMAFLVLILRVRQSCCSSGLVPKECIEQAESVLDLAKNAGPQGLDPDLAEDLLAVLQGQLASAQLEECAVCRNELEEESAMILRECKHVFCEACLSQIRNQVCPMCRVPYGPDDMISKKQASDAAKKKEANKAGKTANKASKLECPPKIQALLDTIEEEMAPDHKGVIFSQFTSYLDIIEIALAKAGHTYTRVDGTMSAADRIDAMEAFDTEGCDSMETPRFILCSLHACGVGVNLTRGNFCFLMDCWWNAAAENQACDRIHRIGQKRPVKIVRFLIDDSIETRMIALQETKSALGKGSLQKLSREEKRKARMTTLHELFQVKDINEVFDT